VYKWIEESSSNAWPCLQTQIVDGWILRFADGYTKRANSIQPLYNGGEAGETQMNSKIEKCESIYFGKNQPAIYKISPFIEPTELEPILAQRGYEKTGQTSVQLLELSSVPEPLHSNVQWDQALNDRWMHNCSRMLQLTDQQKKTMKRMLSQLIPETGFLTLYDHKQQAAACGMAVYESGKLGIYDVVTEASKRQQGWGTELMRHLLHWGKQKGADQCYIQVEAGNKPALNLYGKLGFEEIYQYWYRSKWKKAE
jgi:ribosomal protein S18 acetylase RimI-like enzyme